MVATVKRVSETGRKVVMAFVREKTAADIRAVSVLLGIDIGHMEVLHYENTSQLLIGARDRTAKGGAIDLVVYLTDVMMGLQNSKVLREQVGAQALMYLYRQAKTFVASVHENIAIMHLTRESEPQSFHPLFTYAAKSGGWPLALSVK